MEQPPLGGARAAGRGSMIAALFLANMVLACGPWLVRLAGTESHVGPVAAGFWRLTLALPVLLVACGRSGERLGARPGRPLAIALAAGLFFAADLATWHLGIARTRLANATLLGNVSALLYPVCGFVAARAWPSRRQALALLLAALGAVLLVGRSYHLSAQGLAGDLLCIVAGISYTAYLVAIGQARARLGPVTVLTLAAIAGIPVLLGIAFALGEPIWPAAWAPLLLLTLGSQLVGQGLILLAVGRVPPLVVGLMLLLQPVVAAAIGWLAYAERLGVPDLAGAAAVGAAVLLVRDARAA